MTPNSVYERLVKVGTEWADAEKAANLLEGTLKTVKSRIAISYKDNGSGVQEADLRAEADKDYVQARVYAIEARAEAMRCRVIYQAAQAYIDAWRTVEASERAANRAQI